MSWNIYMKIKMMKSVWLSDQSIQNRYEKEDIKTDSEKMHRFIKSHSKTCTPQNLKN